jgi:PAS domain S-box-containing protein
MAYKSNLAVVVVYMLALAILCAVGVVSYRDGRLEQQSQQWVVHTYDVLGGIDHLNQQLVVTEDDRRGFVLSGDREYSGSFAAACAEARLQLANLRTLTADNPSEQKRLDRLQPALDRYLVLLAERLTNSAAGPNLPSSDAKSAREHLARPVEISEIIAGMQAEEKTLLAERTQAATSSSRLARWFTVLGFVLSAFLILAALVLIRREMAHRELVQQALQDAHAQLERRVEERTHDLAVANQELRRSQERMAMAQSVARIGTFDVDLSAGRAAWTTEMEALYGLAPHGFDGEIGTWRSLIHPGDLAAFNAGYSKSLATHSASSWEFRIILPDGQTRWLASRGRLLPDLDGKVPRFIGVNVDMTDQKMRENEIQALNASLEQRVNERTAELLRANKELETFSYSVAHDLRGPLRHVDGFARILQQEHAAELSEEGCRYLVHILQAITHMGRLVDDMLNLARIGRKELVREKANLDSILRQSLADLPRETQGRDIEWRIESLPEVECDPGLLKLVLSNLLANAAKFTRSRSMAVIEIGTLHENGSTTFFVRDNGVGFDPKYADKLFGVFQRLHRQEDFEGTGVGLATVQRIIHRHGGKVWAEAEPDKGATFFFTLETLPEYAPHGAQEVVGG